MVQIEELAKVIARIIDNRNNGTNRTTDQLMQTIYASLKVDKNFLHANTPDAIRATLDGEDMAGLQRMEIAAKTLIEEYHLDKNDRTSIDKAKELLLYIQKYDRTFSIERMELLAEIEQLTGKF